MNIKPFWILLLSALLVGCAGYREVINVLGEDDVVHSGVVESVEVRTSTTMIRFEDGRGFELEGEQLVSKGDRVRIVRASDGKLDVR